MPRFYIAGALYDRLPRSPIIDRARWWLEAALPRALWWLSRVLPTDAASAIGGFVGGIIGPHLSKQRLILRNLEIALPDLNDRARRTISREIWAEAGRVIAEFALLDRICGPEAAERLEIVLGHDLTRAGTGERPAMFVTAHLSNSELAVTAATRNGVLLSIVSTPQSNPVVQASLERFRRVLGCRYLPSKGGLRQLIREVADGSSLGWITDQRHDRGEMLPFFGVDAATATMPALLALRLDCDLVPARVERLRGCRFRITTYEPLSPEGLEHLPQQEAARELTRRLNTLFEQWIAERPGQWLCFKRRWGKGAQPPGGPMQWPDETSPPTEIADVAPLFHPCSRDPSCPSCIEDEARQPRFDWSFLDGIYCISLQSRDDRAASAAAQLHRLGLCHRAVFYRPQKHPTKPAIGIWESHRAVAVHALARGQRTVLVLEDDVLFGRRVRPRTVRAIAGAVRALPLDWTIFYLGHMARWAYFVRPRVLRVSSTAAHAYIASPRLLEWLRDHPFGTPGIAHVRIAGNGIDSAYAKLPGAYALFPLVAIQSGSPSDYRIGRTKKSKRGKLRHLFSRSRHRELIISKVLRPNQYLMVAVSPAFLLFQYTRSIIERLIGQAMRMTRRVYP